MKKIFFVEDDALIVGIYRRKLAQAGFLVESAADGLAAMKELPAAKPDLIVLDLMMPKFSGVDVLKYIRSHADLKSTPVIILSNAYMSGLSHEAAVAGAEKALVKSRCTPALLLEVVNHLLVGSTLGYDTSLLLAAADIAPTLAAAAAPPSPPKTPPLSMVEPPASIRGAQSSSESHDKHIHDTFLQEAPASLKTIRDLLRAFNTCADPKTRPFRLLDLYRKVHFVSSMAGMAGCHQVAHFASALAALLLELHERPEFINPSTLQTITRSVDFLGELFDRASQAPADDLPLGSVLVVDDDAISNRIMVTTLHQADLKADSAAEPATALKKLQANHYDLVFLDILMPGMDGFELCGKLRALSGYDDTPVIFVTSHADFANRARSVVSGGDDIIAKPVLPVELAVKAVTHLLKRQLARTEKKQ